eukprot:3726-Rhodomonas_salina.1
MAPRWMGATPARARRNPWADRSSSNKDLKRKIDGLGDKLEEMWDELRPEDARGGTGERRRARGELQT